MTIRLDCTEIEIYTLINEKLVIFQMDAIY